MQEPELKVFADSDALAAEAAMLIRKAACQSIEGRGRFTLVLAGGSTPERTYRLLSQADPQSSVDWSRTYLFFGDERLVPHSDSRSNYHMVRESLLATVSIPPEHVFPISTEFATAKQSAMHYAQVLTDFFRTSPGQMPVFDLILLGLGDDGHTASLFPGAAALAVNDVSVTYSTPGVLPPTVDRITLTYPVLNAARQVMFLVSGPNKSAAFRDVWQRSANLQQRPAAGVQLEQGRLTWLVDAAAAAGISSSTVN